MAENTRIPPPKGLGTRGKRLWRDVVKAYTLRVDELVLLESAAKTLDLVEKLDASMEGEPLTVKGSLGQDREHPILSEARQQRALLSRTLKQLGLPDLVEAGKVNQHRTAAQSRWAASRGSAQ